MFFLKPKKDSGNQQTRFEIMTIVNVFKVNGI